MNIFAAIYDFIQAVREALLDILEPLIMPDWGWLVTVILPLTLGAFVLLYFLYLYVRLRRNAWANVDRRPRRLESRLAPPPGVHASAPSWWPVALSVGFFLALLGLVASPILLALGVVITLLGGWGWLRSANREWRGTELSADRGAGAHPLPAGAGAQALAAHATAGASAAVVPRSRALVPHGPTAVMPAAPPSEHAIEPPPGVHMPAPSWWPIYASGAALFALLGLVVSAALLVGGIILALLAFVGWFVDSYRELKVAEGLAPRPHVRDPLAVFPRILASVGALTVLVSVAFWIGPGVVAQLFPAQGAGPGATGGPPACTPTAPIEITARDTAFSTKELCLPAGAPFQLVFHNEDQLPHNVAIGTLFNGEVFTGVATQTYDVPALPAGSYRFICVVHPNVMVGTAIVAGGSAPPGGSQPSPGGPQTSPGP